MKPGHIVILPYYDEAEVDRYMLIADAIESYGTQDVDYSFLLACSPKIKPIQRLYDRFSQIAPTENFECPTQVFGYPQGPTAMFWDCMDHIAATSEDDGCFSLWLESDMVPVKNNWLDMLDQQWNRGGDQLIMGCFVPDVMKYRFISRKRIWIHEHINGGACYRKDFSDGIPEEYRGGAFDTAVYPYIKETGRYQATEALAFSTTERCRKDMADPRRAILHGFMQDKNLFVKRTSRPLTSLDPTYQEASDAIIRIRERLKHIELRFFKRGRRAMMDALLMRQEQAWREGEVTAIAAKIAADDNDTKTSRAA